jgi:hypothetical protein
MISMTLMRELEAGGTGKVVGALWVAISESTIIRALEVTALIDWVLGHWVLSLAIVVSGIWIVTSIIRNRKKDTTSD